MLGKCLDGRNLRMERAATWLKISHHGCTRVRPDGCFPCGPGWCIGRELRVDRYWHDLTVSIGSGANPHCHSVSHAANFAASCRHASLTNIASDGLQLAQKLARRALILIFLGSPYSSFPVRNSVTSSMKASLRTHKKRPVMSAPTEPDIPSRTIRLLKKSSWA
jgi:hypothetical protein